VIGVFYVGLDLGQRNDPSTIAVVEKTGVMRVRHLERIPLGTPYPGVVERVRQITSHRDLARNCALAVDATGVGAPVVDMLRAARLGCDIAAVTITGGERQHQNGSMGVSVPKRDLMAVVQVLLERNELKLARGLRELGALLRELTDVRSTAGVGGRVRLGADGCGEHDDLVIALALACWRAKRPQNGFRTGKLLGF